VGRNVIRHIQGALRGPEVMPPINGRAAVEAGEQRNGGAVITPRSASGADRAKHRRPRRTTARAKRAAIAALTAVRGSELEALRVRNQPAIAPIAATRLRLATPGTGGSVFAAGGVSKSGPDLFGSLKHLPIVAYLAPSVTPGYGQRWFAFSGRGVSRKEAGWFGQAQIEEPTAHGESTGRTSPTRLRRAHST